jgi:hypothetical protein
MPATSACLRSAALRRLELGGQAQLSGMLGCAVRSFYGAAPHPPCPDATTRPLWRGALTAQAEATSWRLTLERQTGRQSHCKTSAICSSQVQLACWGSDVLLALGVLAAPRLRGQRSGDTPHYASQMCLWNRPCTIAPQQTAVTRTHIPRPSINLCSRLVRPVARLLRSHHLVHCTHTVALRCRHHPRTQTP